MATPALICAKVVCGSCANAVRGRTTIKAAMRVSAKSRWIRLFMPLFSLVLMQLQEGQQVGKVLVLEPLLQPIGHQ